MFMLAFVDIFMRMPPFCKWLVFLVFIITQNGGIFKVKNVLKIEKNEYFNYDKEEKCI